MDMDPCFFGCFYDIGSLGEGQSGFVKGFLLATVINLSSVVANQIHTGEGELNLIFDICYAVNVPAGA